MEELSSRASVPLHPAGSFLCGAALEGLRVLSGLLIPQPGFSRHRTVLRRRQRRRKMERGGPEAGGGRRHQKPCVEKEKHVRGGWRQEACAMTRGQAAGEAEPAGRTQAQE